VPTSAVQRGPAGTFSYVISSDNVATAKPVVVTQQNEHDAVIASGLTTSDRVVTTGFANLSDGAKVLIGKDEQAPSADLAPRAKRSRSPDAKGGQKEGKDGEHRGKREHSEGDQKTPASGNEQSGGAAKSQP
jgi:multidrug efflux system membrane fusion protein